MSTELCGNDLSDLIREHEELNVHIDAEQAWWHEVRELGRPQFGEMSLRLTGLKTRLAAHFAHEETVAQTSGISGGPDRPQIDAGRVADEHYVLLARLNVMIEKAAACEGYGSWGELGLAFSELMHDVEEHETKELRALQEATQRSQSQTTGAER